MSDKTVDAGSISAEEFRARVVTELNRLAALPAVNEDSGGVDSFGTGARWVHRMIREAIVGRAAPAANVVRLVVAREQP